VRRPGRPASQRVSTVAQALAWATADTVQLTHPGSLAP